MKTTLERIEKNKVALEIEIEQERLEKSLDRAYRKLARQVNIPGFRKGKAPRTVIEAYVGYGAVLEEALEEVIPETYQQAVKENNLEPVAQPNIDIVQAEKGQPVIYKATVTVKPEVELGEYKGLSVSVPAFEVTEEDVENRLNLMRNRYARLEKVDDDTPAEMGNTVLIDFVGSIDGVPFAGGTAEDYSLELGSGRFIPGFEEQLVGAKTGEEVLVKVTFPENYHNKELAGKDAEFKVTVKEIKKKVLSDLDDAFAQEVSDFDTLEELRADIKKNLEEMSEYRRKQMATDAIVQQAMANANVDIPEDMIENRIYQLVEELAERLAYQGVSLEEYLENTETSWDDLKNQFRPEAENLVRRELVLLAVAEKEGLTVSEEDFEESVRKAAADYGVSFEEVKKSVEPSRKRIEEGILMDKAISFLYDHADITVDNKNE